MHQNSGIIRTVAVLIFVSSMLNMTTLKPVCLRERTLRELIASNYSLFLALGFWKTRDINPGRVRCNSYISKPSFFVVMSDIPLRIYADLLVQISFQFNSLKHEEEREREKSNEGEISERLHFV